MKRTIFSLAVAMACGLVHAQDEAPTAVVKVENNYKPVVVEVNKRSFTPTVAGEANVTPLELKFSKQANPFDRFTSERNIKELLPKQESPNPGYARLGYGTGGGIDAKLAYKLNTGKNGIMRMLAALDGFNDDIEGQYRDWDSRMYRTLFDADYTHEFKYLTLNVVGNFNNRVFNYQKAGDELYITDKQNCKDYTFATKGASKLAGPFSYTFNAGYTHSRRAYTDGFEKFIAQNRITAGGSAAYEVYDTELRKVGADIKLDIYLYNSTLRKAIPGYRNFASFDIDPYLDFNFGKWKLSLGTNVNIRTSGGAAIAIAPDIKVEGYCADNLSLYASVTGGRTDNGFEQMEAVSPYWNFDSKYGGQLKPTYKVADFSAGSRVSLENLTVDIYAGYAYTKDDLLQTTSYSTIYNPNALMFVEIAQQNTHDIYIGGRAGYDLLGWIKLAAYARYDHWKCDNGNLLMMKPEFHAAIEAEAEPLKGLTAKASYSFTSHTAGDKNRRIGNRYSLDARVSYRINSMFGAYIQGENLLNSNYYEYAGYITRGIRGMAGLTMNF